MQDAPVRLSDQVVATHPLDAGGASGNTVERVTLADGRELIRKRVSPEWDWISRATNDHGRALTMWNSGLFKRIPTAIDHATVAVEADDPGWSIFMNDVSASLIPGDRRMDRALVQRILAAMAEFHHAFWGESFPDLCSLVDRYSLLSPATALREQERANPVGDIIGRCWDLFSEMVPDDIATAILAIAHDPARLGDQLRKCEQTLIHGDLRLSNLGLTRDRVVVIDWGERTGTAPAAVELASFMIFDGTRIDASPDGMIADFRSVYGDRFDDRALQLALIGGLVQLGGNFVLDIALGGETRRAPLHLSACGGGPTRPPAPWRCGRPSESAGGRSENDLHAREPVRCYLLRTGCGQTRWSS